MTFCNTTMASQCLTRNSDWVYGSSQIHPRLPSTFGFHSLQISAQASLS